MPQTFLILRRNERDVIKMYTGLHMRYRYSCQILTYFDFFITFSENSQISNSMKSLQWKPSCSMQAERRRKTGGQTDMIKIIVAFRNFEKEPKNTNKCHICMNKADEP
jgi:hypothetical protein